MKAYYSLIRYAPDVVRGELLNVGIVVVVPSIAFMDFRIHENQTTRIRYFDPSVNFEELEFLKGRLTVYTPSFSSNGRAYSNALTQLQKELSGTRFFLSEFRDLMFPEGHPPWDSYYGFVLDQLLKRFVKPRPAPARTSPKDQLVSRTFQMLENHGLYSRVGPAFVKRSYRPRNSPYEFDAGFRNGVDHLVEFAEVKDLSDENHVINKVGNSLSKFAALQQISSLEAKCIMALGAQRRDGRRNSPSIRALEHLGEVYFLDEDQERRKFLNRISEAAKHLS